MSKITVISDVHGRTDWKKIVALNQNSDLFIFIGDYLDSFDIKPIDQYNNLLDILEFKRNNIDKVVLLFGNHDFVYTPFCLGTYSGWKAMTSLLCQQVLLDAINEGLFKMCYIHDNYLFTHAGVSKTWCKQFNINIKDLENSMNEAFITTPKIFNFNQGRNFSNTGDDVCQTPIWIRPNSLNKDMINGYIQIVGHTPQNEIDLDKYDRKIILTDCQENKEYLTINNGYLKINNYE